MKFTISIGAMAPPFSKQLKGMGFSKDLLKEWQKTNDSITFLSIKGMMSDSQRTSCEKRLINQIKRNLGRGE